MRMLLTFVAGIRVECVVNVDEEIDHGGLLQQLKLGGQDVLGVEQLGLLKELQEREDKV